MYFEPFCMRYPHLTLFLQSSCTWYPHSTLFLRLSCIRYPHLTVSSALLHAISSFDIVSSVLHGFSQLFKFTIPNRAPETCVVSVKCYLRDIEIKKHWYILLPEFFAEEHARVSFITYFVAKYCINLHN